MLRIVCVCLMLLVAPFGSTPAAPAEDVTRGNWLLGSCQAAVKTFDDPSYHEDLYEAYRDGYCRGLVMGVSAASPLICPDDNVIHSQQVRVVLKYMQDHPEDLHLEGTQLVYEALKKAFPCKR